MKRLVAGRRSGKSEALEGKKRKVDICEIVLEVVYNKNVGKVLENKRSYDRRVRGFKLV
jgi:hypothetical protein